MKLVRVALDIPIDRLFDYLPPEENGAIPPGTRVQVFLGTRKQTGWVVDTVEGEPPAGEIKKILSVRDEVPLVTRELMDLAGFLSLEYFSSLGQSLAVFGKNLSRARIAGECSGAQQPSPDGYPEMSATVREIFDRQGPDPVYVEFRQDSVRLDVYRELVLAGPPGSRVFLFPQVSQAERFHQEAVHLVGDRAVLFHGDLSRGKRTQAWTKMLEGRRLVAVGTRLAVFAPLADLSLICVDEGSSFLFQEQQTPRYHAVAVALWRARRAGAAVVIGESAFSVDEYRDVKERGRVVPAGEPAAEKPSCHVIPLGKDRMDTAMPFLARETVSLVEECMVQERTVVFLHHRKEAARILVCGKCGNRFLCPQCRIPLAALPDGSELVCRTCAFRQDMVRKCTCGSRKISVRGFGLDRMRKLLENAYPGLAVARIVGGREERTVPEGCRVIVGTTAVAETVREIEVHLVVIVNGDAFFNIPDFRAEERFFLLVRGLVARSKNRGTRILIQAYSPSLNIYKALSEDSPCVFYDNELKVREQLKYPPFGRIVQVELETGTAPALERRRRLVDEFCVQEGMEPLYAGEPISRPAGKTRVWKYLFRADDPESNERIRRLLARVPASVEVNPGAV